MISYVVALPGPSYPAWIFAVQSALALKAAKAVVAGAHLVWINLLVL